ncbi:MAG: aminomethyl-transferring glycine dehydrogenase subunit GcvPA [Spirochaetia bacterium]|nr:aminomethyl-transferring glycine dehydrogenase subunit GcvPA [Spirochaetia bacterium]
MYINETDSETALIFKELNIKSAEELFKSIPEEFLEKTSEKLNRPLSESEIKKEIYAAEKNIFQGLSFAGYGLYEHFVPEVINHLSSLRPFVTSYTPYQPEAAQGTLQALFEYQSLMAGLTSMDIANASLYDGATALVEAIRMAVRNCKKKDKKIVLISDGIHPVYHKVLETYFPESYQKELEISIKKVPLDKKDGNTIWENFSSNAADVLAVAYQQPNCYGIFEENQCLIAKTYPEAQILYGTNEPLSLTVLPAPSDIGAHVVWGEAQSLGIPVSFGGPSLGFIAAKSEYMRQMPGRLVGKTTAETPFGEETEAYVIALSTREQHIRREKATSNICSNQTLVALRAAIYMAHSGWEGMRKTAVDCVKNADYLKKELLKIKSIEILFHEAVNFHEITWTHQNIDQIIQNSYEDEIAPGVENMHEGKKYLISYVSEEKSEGEINRLIEIIRKFS